MEKLGRIAMIFAIMARVSALERAKGIRIIVAWSEGANIAVIDYD
ncbi:hypothetical protein TcasGA2_TC032659 [Tribolium castaneum]|uniref:Uncharacterized protein n=1 Tax=Tribolium castaneum TaxID=7070 RepID=A0A139WK41_TRICA|nr:hypothetical protein TcasGA2_TC032659 [Tribolium castaneum]